MLVDTQQGLQIPTVNHVFSGQPCLRRQIHDFAKRNRLDAQAAVKLAEANGVALDSRKKICRRFSVGEHSSKSRNGLCQPPLILEEPAGFCMDRFPSTSRFFKTARTLTTTSQSWQSILAMILLGPKMLVISEDMAFSALVWTEEYTEVMDDVFLLYFHQNPQICLKTIHGVSNGFWLLVAHV